jgi:hypothetical protein
MHQGACSTWKEEERLALADTTRLSDQGIFKYDRYCAGAQCSWETEAVCFARQLLTLMCQWPRRALMDLRVEDIGPPPAFGSLFVSDFAMRNVVRQSNIVGQAAIHKRTGFAAEFFTPRPVFGLLPEDLIEG